MKEDKTLTAYKKIKESLVSGELDASTPLSEAYFVEKLQMSRTPIRSALQRLQHEGFVRIIPKQGVIIKEISMDEAMQLFDLRTVVEQYLIAHSIFLLDDSDYETLCGYIEKQKIAAANKDYSSFLELDKEFHVFCYHHYHNDFMIDIINNYRERFYSWRYQSLTVNRRMEASIQEHQQFVDLIMAHKNQEACVLLEEHVGNAIRQAQKRIPKY